MQRIAGPLLPWLIVTASCTVIASCTPDPVAPSRLDPIDIPATETSTPTISDEPVEEPAADIHRTASGITWTVLRRGTGTVRPQKNDSVSVHFEGWKMDGSRFDSSRQRGRPATFGLTKVIKGWTEVLQLMVSGDNWRVEIPSHLAYGDKPTLPGSPAGDLTFEIELLEIIAAPTVPDHVAGPSPTAKVTASGLAYEVLTKGMGRVSPTQHDKVKVHYSGWTTDGIMFDSSVTRGKPANFPLSGVIKGWTEGLQLMAEGDLYRFWIPPKLAYGLTPKRSGAPAGMLVFDVELIRINP